MSKLAFLPFYCTLLVALFMTQALPPLLSSPQLLEVMETLAASRLLSGLRGQGLSWDQEGIDRYASTFLSTAFHVWGPGLGVLDIHCLTWQVGYSSSFLEQLPPIKWLVKEFKTEQWLSYQTIALPAIHESVHDIKNLEPKIQHAIPLREQY